MVAYVIFIKERTHNQGELDLYKEMAPTALAGHPITLHRARTQGSRRGPGLRGHDDAGIQPLGRRELGMTAQPTKR